MQCIHCGKSPGEHGITLLRQNPKGEAGVWACEVCNTQPVDTEVAEAVAHVQSALLPPNKFRMN